MRFWNRVSAVPRPGFSFSGRRFVSPILFASFLVAWWSAFGPAVLGGPATFAIVDGRSMEPTYRFGDLVVARKADEYGPGDVVVFPATNGRVIIHRIVDGNSIEGWRTQGDNNESADRWILPDEGILGKKWFSVPELGHAFLWTQRHPWLFASTVGAVVVALTALSGRRRRLDPRLSSKLVGNRRVLPWEVRPVTEIGIFFLASLAAVSSFFSVVVLWSVDMVDSTAGLVSFGILGTAAPLALGLSRRVFDGRGAKEPTCSKIVLSEECRIVDELPEVHEQVVCLSPHDLRRVLRKRNLPVLRRDNLDGSSSFLTIDERGTAHSWHAPRSGSADGAAIRTVRIPHDATAVR